MIGRALRRALERASAQAGYGKAPDVFPQLRDGTYTLVSAHAVEVFGCRRVANVAKSVGFQRCTYSIQG